MYNDNGLGYSSSLFICLQISVNHTSKGAMQNTDAVERYISTKTLLLTIKNYYIDDQSNFRLFSDSSCFTQCEIFQTMVYRCLTTDTLILFVSNCRSLV